MNTPYGVILPNGINLAKSVKNPYSRLALLIRTIKYLQGDPLSYPTTKRNIIPYMGYRYPCVSRGWGSGIFSIARKAGFITYDSKTNQWNLGPRASEVTLYF